MSAAAQIAKTEYEYKAIRQLGISILVRAAEDAFMTKPTICHTKHVDLVKTSAINFLTGSTKPEDLYTICELAGVNAETIIKETKNFLDKGISDVDSFTKMAFIRDRLK